MKQFLTHTNPLIREFVKILIENPDKTINLNVHQTISTFSVERFPYFFDILRGDLQISKYGGIVRRISKFVTSDATASAKFLYYLIKSETKAYYG